MQLSKKLWGVWSHSNLCIYKKRPNIYNIINFQFKTEFWIYEISRHKVNFYLKGELLHTIENLHNTSIFGIRIFENILATAGSSGSIKFHQIEEKSEPKLIHEENGYGFAHLDNDENKLISGSINGEIVVWNFKTREKLGSINARYDFT